MLCLYSGGTHRMYTALSQELPSTVGISFSGGKYEPLLRQPETDLQATLTDWWGRVDKISFCDIPGQNRVTRYIHTLMQSCYIPAGLSVLGVPSQLETHDLLINGRSVLHRLAQPLDRQCASRFFWDR